MKICHRLRAAHGACSLFAVRLPSLPHARLLACLAAVPLIAGCGSSSSSSSAAGHASTTRDREHRTGPDDHLGRAAGRRVASSRRPSIPSSASSRRANGRTLTKLGELVKSSAQLGAATGTFTPGTRRLALRAHAQRAASSSTRRPLSTSPRPPTSPASGPYLAPADPMSVAPQYRSKQNSGPGGIKAIYADAAADPARRHVHGAGASRERHQGADRLARGDRRGRVLADPERRPAPARHRDRHASRPCTATPRC